MPEQPNVVVVQPGDTLIVRIDGLLTREQVDNVAGHLKAALPGVRPLVINAAQLMVYREDGSSDD